MRSVGALFWSLCLLVSSACATSATIRAPQDPPIEARIVGSGADGLDVETEAGDKTRVPRAGIVDIDHPGKSLVLAGLCILAKTQR